MNELATLSNSTSVKLTAPGPRTFDLFFSIYTDLPLHPASLHMLQLVIHHDVASQRRDGTIDLLIQVTSIS